MWRKIISELLASGLTESGLVALLKKAGCTTTQPTINRLKRGVMSRPGYDLGTALTTLHEKRCNERAA